MKSSGVVKKFFTLLLSSVIASLIIIAVKTAFSPDNQRRKDNINKKIESTTQDLENLKSSSLVFFKEPMILHKELELQSLKLELAGGDRNFFELFMTNCSANLLIYTFDILLLLIIYPFVASLILYHCFAPIVEKFKPIMAWGDSSKNIFMANVKSALKVKLNSVEHLFFRGDWIGNRCDVRVKTKLMWKWNAPFVTFAAQLFELKEYFSERGKCGEITIAAPAADLYIGEILLQKNSAIVIRPKYLIGVSDGIKIQAIWNFSLHNIFAGKIRQIVLYGEGRVFIYGYQGVNCITAEGKNYKIESDLLIGYDARSAYSLCRTETWWHYFRKESDRCVPPLKCKI